MNPFAWPILADENVSAAVIEALRERGTRVTSVHGVELAGRRDRDLLRHAVAHGEVVLTHDSDFGTLAVRTGEPYIGIIYLRPGHISAASVVELIDAVHGCGREVEPPFIVVAERRDGRARIRIRSDFAAR